MVFPKFSRPSQDLEFSEHFKAFAGFEFSKISTGLEFSNPSQGLWWPRISVKKLSAIQGHPREFREIRKIFFFCSSDEKRVVQKNIETCDSWLFLKLSRREKTRSGLGPNGANPVFRVEFQQKIFLKGQIYGGGGYQEKNGKKIGFSGLKPGICEELGLFIEFRSFSRIFGSVKKWSYQSGRVCRGGHQDALRAGGPHGCRGTHSIWEQREPAHRAGAQVVREWQPGQAQRHGRGGGGTGGQGDQDGSETAAAEGGGQRLSDHWSDDGSILRIDDQRRQFGDWSGDRDWEYSSPEQCTMITQMV